MMGNIKVPLTASGTEHPELWTTELTLPQKDVLFQQRLTTYFFIIKKVEGLKNVLHTMGKKEFLRPFGNNVLKLCKFVHNYFLFRSEKEPPGIYETIISFCWNYEWKKLSRKLWHLQDHPTAILNSSFPSSFTSYFTNSKSKSSLICIFCIKFSFPFVFPCRMFSSLSTHSYTTQSIISLCPVCVLCSSQCQSPDKEHWAGNFWSCCLIVAAVPIEDANNNIQWMLCVALPSLWGECSFDRLDNEVGCGGGQLLLDMCTC